MSVFVALAADPEVGALHLTLPQLGMLDLICTAREGQTMSALAGALGVHLPTITRIADKLVELGVAERSADPADRRRVLVVPTAKGARLYKRACALVAA